MSDLATVANQLKGSFHTETGDCDCGWIHYNQSTVYGRLPNAQPSAEMQLVKSSVADGVYTADVVGLCHPIQDEWGRSTSDLSIEICDVQQLSWDVHPDYRRPAPPRPDEPDELNRLGPNRFEWSYWELVEPLGCSPQHHPMEWKRKTARFTVSGDDTGVMAVYWHLGRVYGEWKESREWAETYLRCEGDRGELSAIGVFDV